MCLQSTDHVILSTIPELTLCMKFSIDPDISGHIYAVQYFSNKAIIAMAHLAEKTINDIQSTAALA